MESPAGTPTPTPSPIPIDPSGAANFGAYLAERGLRSHADQLGLSFITRQQLAAKLGRDPYSAAVGIPYHAADGTEIMDAGEKYSRYRLLTPPANTGKYRQKSGSLPHAYLTPLGTDWGEVAADPTTAVLFTEGELKAARAALTPGFPPTVGLGGVDSWTGGRAGTPLLPELQNWIWRGRTVYIAFDADLGTEGYKPTVAAALDRMASAFNELGAFPKILHLGRAVPRSDKEPQKIGLDDYILAGGTWNMLLLTAEDAQGTDDVRRLLVRFAVCRGRIVDLESGEEYTLAVFTGVAAAQYTIPTDKGPRPAAPFFLAHPRRTEIHSVGIWPLHQPGLTRIPRVEADGGQPEGGGTDDTVLVLNRFVPPPGWSRAQTPTPEQQEQSQQTVSVWTKFIDDFFEAEPGFATKFHDWVGHAVRFPHLRNSTSWILQSPAQGVGKSLVGSVVAAMVKEQLGYVGGPEAFGAQWNHLLRNKLFVLLDEVEDTTGFYRAFKAHRTMDTRTINEKYKNSVTVANTTNYIITTNEATPYRIEKDSRRDIVYTPGKQQGDSEWRAFMDTRIVPILKDPEKLRHLLEWYRHDRPITPDYDYTAPAPQSSAKTSVEDDSRSPAESVAQELVAQLTAAGALPAVLTAGAMRRLVPGNWQTVRKRVKLFMPPGKVLTERVYDAQGVQQRVTVLGVTKSEFDTWPNARRRELMERTDAKLFEFPPLEG